MSTHVIILAQGQQKRLPDLDVPKQMLELPACGDIAIIERTLCQLAMIDPTALVTVVCGGPMMIMLPLAGRPLVERATGVILNIGSYQLRDPGNSSLKGIARYLADRDDTGRESPRFEGVTIDKTVILLGDVIYSWACLHACTTPTHWGVNFVGTSDLSRSGGELWGIVLENRARGPMEETLRKALANHPPFEEYQPGQMRRWLWAMDEYIDVNPIAAGMAGLRRTWFTAIDDYTRDIDLPEHVLELGRLSEIAARDDAAHSLDWGRKRGES